MRTTTALALIASLAAAPAAIADTPNASALRAQAGAEMQVPPALLSGMFEGQFLYVDGRAPGPFTVALQADGPGRWSGMVRDQGGPQAKVVVTYDGLVFQMSKQYPANRPAEYSEWVFYVGTIKHDPATGYAQAVGTWSIPGSPADWGFFEISFGQ